MSVCLLGCLPVGLKNINDDKDNIGYSLLIYVYSRVAIRETAVITDYKEHC